jgi:hypothetical protein
MRFVLWSAFCLFTAAPSRGLTIVDFAIGNVTLPSFSQSGLTVTGSADLHFFLPFPNIGTFGVVGGRDDNLVDPGEYVDFSFSQPVIDVGYGVNASYGPVFPAGGIRRVTE